MNSERAQAYGRVIHQLEQLADDLQTAEADRIRESADTLLFAAQPQGEEATQALHDAEDLIYHLIEVERLTEEQGQRLLIDLADCGALAPVL